MLKFIDSYDHYTTGFLADKYSANINSPEISTGRFNNGLYSDNQNSGNNAVRMAGYGNHATWIIGCAFFIDLQHTATAPIMGIMDGTSRQFDVRITTGNVLVVTRDGTTVATGTTVLSVSTWYYIELKVVIGNAGSYELRLQGSTELVDATEDTQATANAFGNGFFIGKATNSPAGIHRYDDLYVCDGSGGVNDDFLGDVRVQCMFPSGNGNSSQFDGSDGNTTDNYLLVDEAAPDNETTYVQSPDIGDKDTYAYSDLTPTAGDVFGVQIVPYCRKTDAGTRSLVSVARLSGTEEDSSDKALSTSYIYMADIRETKPGGGSWTISDVNSSEFGVKVSA